MLLDSDNAGPQAPPALDGRCGRLRRLEAVASLARAVLAGTPLGELVQGACAAVAAALDADLAIVLRPAGDGTCAILVSYPPDPSLRERRVPPGASQGGYQLAAGLDCILVEDYASETRFTPPPTLVERGLRSSVSCRIDAADAPFGVLAVASRRASAFDEEDASFVMSIAALVGSAVQRDDAEAQRRQAEAELRDTAERFRMLAENSQDVIFRYRVGDDPGFDYLSPAVTRITGLTPEDLYRDPGAVLAHVVEEDLRLGDETTTDDSPIVFRWRRRDGRVVWLERRGVLIRDAHGEVIAEEGVVRDVTDRVEQEARRRELEEQLRQSQRLEAIGQLAGGIAHDFNNLLLAIRGYGELALRRVERGDTDVGGELRDLLDAADRAAELTRQLLAFGRRQVMHLEVIDLRDVVVDMDRLLRRWIGEQVELVVVRPPEPVLVEADRGQLEQVLANLAVNARDAMHDGGRLEIAVAVAPDGREAVLSVADTGCGMDAETAARVFEPFFTTKGEDGSGLGLSTVHGIVSQSGGRIELDSSLGRGSTFSIHLPLSGKEPALPAEAPATARGRGETVLVVEDDAMVRKIVAAMLAERGYGVLEADGAESALAVARHEPAVDLVLSDLVMPGANGRETVALLRELLPEAKTIFMSGYADDVVIRSGGPEPGTAFIQKPFDGEELARCVRDVLGAPAETAA